MERYLSAAASPLTIDTVAPGRSADVVPALSQACGIDGRRSTSPWIKGLFREGATLSPVLMQVDAASAIADTQGSYGSPPMRIMPRKPPCWSQPPVASII